MNRARDVARYNFPGVMQATSALTMIFFRVRSTIAVIAGPVTDDTARAWSAAHVCRQEIGGKLAGNGQMPNRQWNVVAPCIKVARLPYRE
ncbi:MAG: hypothetical protein ACJ8G3_11405 [Burkholderiaceae bacterium]